MADFDASVIDGLFSEPVVLDSHGLALGLMHRQGAGLRVCTFDGAHVRHMSQAAARRFARQLAESDSAAELKPVTEALDRLADRIDEITAHVAAERAKLAAMPVEGCA